MWIIAAIELSIAAYLGWSTFNDLRLGRVPAAMTLGRVHYAPRRDAPILFWVFTGLRALVFIAILSHGFDSVVAALHGV